MTRKISLKPSNRFYVYSLSDPRDGIEFYIGKGSGKRISRHVQIVRSGRLDNPVKCCIIAEIHAQNLEVVESFIATGLCEADAFELERNLIRSRKPIANIYPGCKSRDRWAGHYMLTRLKSYAEWMRTAPAQVARVNSTFGNAGDFYQRFVDECRGLINEPSFSTRFSCAE